MNENGKSFVFLAYIGWGSALVLIWLLLLDVVRPSPWMATGAFLFFVVVGLFSSGLAYGKRRDDRTRELLQRIAHGLPAKDSPDTYRENHDIST